MALPDRVTVSVPGSSANLGPGFDCLGVALPLRLTVTVVRRPGALAVELSGEGADELPADASNLVVATIVDGGDGDGLAIGIANELPLAAAAAPPPRRSWPVSPPATRCRAADRPRGPEPARGRHRGPPDNIAAAVYGGFTIATGDPPMVRRIEPPRGLGFVLAVPPERLAPPPPAPRWPSRRCAPTPCTTSSASRCSSRRSTPAASTTSRPRCPTGSIRTPARTSCRRSRACRCWPTASTRSA
jgi:hypothetical protein